MNFEDLANTIRTRFKTQIADTQSLPTQYDNQDFTPPDQELWARLTILHGDSFQVSNGGPDGKRFRTPGIMTVQVFIPSGQGDKAAYKLADVIETYFRSQKADSITYRTPSVRKIGPTGPWWQINVNCPFYSDDIG